VLLTYDCVLLALLLGAIRLVEWAIISHCRVVVGLLLLLLLLLTLKLVGLRFDTVGLDEAVLTIYGKLLQALGFADERKLMQRGLEIRSLVWPGKVGIKCHLRLSLRLTTIAATIRRNPLSQT